MQPHVRKVIVAGIIVLFVGAGVVTSTATTTKTQTEPSQMDNTKKGLFPPNNYDFLRNIDILPKSRESESSVNDIECSNHDFYLNNAHPQSSITKKWTWMFYDDADFYNAYDPLVDQVSGCPTFAEETCSGENLDVIVLQDKEHSPAKLWYIDEHHDMVLLEEMGEVNMGDAHTLRDFITYAKNRYPAERYLISLYNHGGGWMGACVDDTDNDMLTMDEIQVAMTEAGDVDIICFTAPCLMGALESVYELRECVEVYIGSEELSGYGHWWGTIEGMCNLLDNESDLSNVAIGRQIIHLIENNTPWPASITMSAIRTDKMEDLARSLDIVAQSLIEDYSESYDKIWSIYNDIQYFSSGGILDTYDFAEKYLNVETDPTIRQNLINVMSGISDAVIAECHGSDYPDAHGLTIYFPPKKSKYNSQYSTAEYGLDFSQNTNWDEFLLVFMKEKTKPATNLLQIQFLERFTTHFPILVRLVNTGI